MVYILKFVKEITPVIKASQNVLLIGDNVTFDASGSYFGS
jgi:hypothetical protein